jgi:thioredoxin 1
MLRVKNKFMEAMYMKVAMQFLISLLVFCSFASAAPIPDVPAKGMVTMVDIGAKACVPCKMMMPVMEEVEKEYKGRAAIVFIDVWENRDQGAKFGIKLIPTQIFYDKNGTEVYRHEGFLDKDSISERLNKLLAQ